MKRALGVGAGIILGAVACGGTFEAKDAEGSIALSSSALVCSAAGSYSVALTGTQQYIYGADYKCSGVVPASETAKVDITPGAVAGEWLVKFVNSGTTWTVTEKNGIIDWTFQATISSDAIKIGCGWTGSLRVVVDESNITVRHYCRHMSGTSGCTRYSDVTGTMPRDCAPPPPPPPPPDPDSGVGDPPDPDAGTRPDASGSDASAAPDSSAPPDEAPTTGGSTTPEPPAPAESSSGPPSTARSSSTPESDAAGKPISCAASAGGSSSSSFVILLAAAIGMAFARRRRPMSRP